MGNDRMIWVQQQLVVQLVVSVRGKKIKGKDKDYIAILQNQNDYLGSEDENEQKGYIDREYMMVLLRISLGCEMARNNSKRDIQEGKGFVFVLLWE